MPAGDFDKRVELQSPTETRNAMGGVDRTWTTQRKCWAKVEETGGRELFRAQQTKPEVSAVITLRQKVTGLDSTYRVRFKCDGQTRTFDVRAVLGASDRRVYGRGQVLHVTENL